MPWSKLAVMGGFPKRLLRSTGGRAGLALSELLTLLLSPPGLHSRGVLHLLLRAHHSEMFRFEGGFYIDGPYAGSRLQAVTCRVEAGMLVMIDCDAVITKVS